MTRFDPEKWKDKYVHYLADLEAVYSRAFETMNDAYDSDLIHAIDQQVLDESEPVYEGDGAFRIELPDDPYGRIQGVLVREERFGAVLDAYVEELERELERVFEFDE